MNQKEICSKLNSIIKESILDNNKVLKEDIKSLLGKYILIYNRIKLLEKENIIIDGIKKEDISLIIKVLNNYRRVLESNKKVNEDIIYSDFKIYYNRFEEYINIISNYFDNNSTKKYIKK